MIKLEGAIEGRPPRGRVGTWRIAGRSVSVLEPATVVEDAGAALPGARAVVIGEELSDDTIQAVLVHVVESPSVGSSPVHDAPGSPEVRLRGVVEARRGPAYVVDGHTIRVEPGAADASPQLADIVEVVALPTRGEFYAKAISIMARAEGGTRYVKRATVRSMPHTLIGWWLLGDDRVLVTADTLLADRPRVGDEIWILATRHDNGVIVAGELLAGSKPLHSSMSSARVVPPFVCAN